MPSTISRRQLLASLGFAGTAGVSYGAYRLWRGGPDASFDGLTPVDGTWPMERYDSAKTAHNPHAAPPREEPTLERSLTPAEPESRFRALASQEYLALYGTSLHLYERDGTEPVWSDSRGTPVAGFGPAGDLYGVRETPTEPDAEYALFSIDTEGETAESFSTPYEEADVEGFVVDSGAVYAGTDTSRDLTALSPVTDQSWTVSGVRPAIADGRLYAAGAFEGLAAYGERSGIDRALAVGPERLWTAEEPRGEANSPAVADGRIAVGSFGIHDEEGSLGCYDAATGERLWEPRDFGMYVSTPALSGSTGFLAAGTDGLESGVVAAIDMPTGETIWRDEVDWYAFSPVVGGQTLIVAGEIRAGEAAPAGTVRAYDTSSGEVLWTITDEFDPDSLAVVGDSVLVSGVGGVYEYR